MPLRIEVPVLPARGGAALVEGLFEPLGWQVRREPVALDEQFPEWGDSRYVGLVLEGEMRLSDALRHLYVLLPVLDDAKHYWVSAGRGRQAAALRGGLARRATRSRS